jgi:hypothetical protein
MTASHDFVCRLCADSVTQGQPQRS